MPKLTQDALNKRFTCQYCGESVRTRQGLSGHIQFKHPKGEIDPYLDVHEVLLRADVMEDVAKKHTLENPTPSILKHWVAALVCLKTVDIKCTTQDFKNYMLVSLAQRAENERLREELVNDFQNIIALNK